MNFLKVKLLTLIVFFTCSMISHAAPFIIEIKRVSHNTSSLTGELFVNGSFLSHTLELPWNNNRSFISSIPSGTYDALLRYDKNDKWRLQLTNVPDRSGVQIHIGNWPSQIEGCVLVGNKVNNPSNSLEQSSEAYKKLKDSFYGSSNPNMTPDLTVKVKVSYYPGRTSFSGNDFHMGYQDEGRWKFSADGDSYNFIEKYRDEKYIYLSGKVDGESVYVRAPLFGGRMAQSQSINGPWSAEDAPEVTRSN